MLDNLAQNPVQKKKELFKAASSSQGVLSGEEKSFHQTNQHFLLFKQVLCQLDLHICLFLIYLLQKRKEKTQEILYSLIMKEGQL